MADAFQRQEASAIGNQQHITHYEVPARSVFDPARFDLADLGIDVRPSFSIRSEDRIFVIGSCFAREIDTAIVELFPASERAEAPGEAPAATGS